MPDETREERIRRYAYNRWELRQFYKFRENDTAEDDWICAEAQIKREELRELSNGKI